MRFKRISTKQILYFIPFRYIPFKYPELTSDPYKVICPFVGGQSNNILDMDDALTLKEANLYPTVILHLRNED